MPQPADTTTMVDMWGSYCRHCGSALDTGDEIICPYCLHDPKEEVQNGDVVALTNVNDGPPSAISSDLQGLFAELAERDPERD